MQCLPKIKCYKCLLVFICKCRGVTLINMNTFVNSLYPLRILMGSVYLWIVHTLWMYIGLDPLPPPETNEIISLNPQPIPIHPTHRNKNNGSVNAVSLLELLSVLSNKSINSSWQFSLFLSRCIIYACQCWFKFDHKFLVIY